MPTPPATACAAPVIRMLSLKPTPVSVTTPITMPDGRGGSAHGQCVLGAGAEGLDQRRGGDPPVDPQRFHQERREHEGDGKNAELEVVVFDAAEHHDHQHHMQDGHQGPVAHRVAMGAGAQADDGARCDAGERGQVGGAPRHQDADQQRQRDQGRPALGKAFPQLGHLFGRQAAQAIALGLEMHLHEDAEEVHRGRNRRSGDDGLVGQRQELDHQEGGGAQHRRRDLAAGGRCRLDGCREFALVADTDHGRDGQRSDRHRIGHAGAGQHAEQCRPEHADLGRPAGITTGDAAGHVQEQLAQPDAGGEHAEQHEVKHIGGHHADRHAIDALAGQVLVVDQLRPVRTRVLEQARKHRAGQRVGHEQRWR